MAASRDTIQDLGFTAHKQFVHPDVRGRVTLGGAVRDADYRVLVNERGQVLLDPVVAIPASEAWLWQNAALRESMNRALEQASRDEFHDLGSFAQDAEDEEEG